MLPRSKISNAAGPRNNLVSVQRASNGEASSAGERLPEWSTICERWCSSSITSGREFTAALSVQPMLQSIQEMPYDEVTATISPRDRIVDDGRILNVNAVFNESENNEKIILWLTEPVET